MIVNANMIVQKIVQSKNGAVISFTVGVKSIIGAKIILWILAYALVRLMHI